MDQKNMLTRANHEFGPLYDRRSRILILGSFPSVKSRGQKFYYAHPQNRFWKVLAAVLKEAVPSEIPGKRAMLLRHGIALWDVLQSCEIRGSSDSSIRSPEPVNIEIITEHCPIEKIAVNGGTAGKYYDKYLKSRTGMTAVRLPSTSPANASWSLERLIKAWREGLVGENSLIPDVRPSAENIRSATDAGSQKAAENQ